MAKIEKTKSGKYRTRVYIGKDADGKKHWKSITHSDKRTLKLIAGELEFNREEELNCEYDTFSKTADAYIDAKEAVLSPSTVRSYKCMLNTLNEHYGAFTALRIDKIDRDNMQWLVSSLVTNKKSPKYVRNIYRLISGIFKSVGLTMPEATLPKAVKPKVYEPTEDDVKATIRAARGLRIEIPILLGIRGLRRGEICALKYPDDFDGNIIHVHRSAVYVGKNQQIEKPPKNAESDRYVPLGDEVVQKIAEQGYVTDYTLGALSEEFPDFLKRNNIPKYRFHDLRHFFVAYLHDQGYTDAEIQYIGGWKTDSVMKRNYRYALDKKSLNKKLQDTMKRLM